MKRTSISIALALSMAASAHSQQNDNKPLATNTMTTPDFTTTILVNQTPAEAFNAINNVRGWWSEDIEGDTDKLNATFHYHFKDLHRCTMKITEMVPGKKVVWFVEDNYFDFTKDKSEWVGTKIVFDIAAQAGKTRITFTHEGLVPEYECYHVCHDAWTGFIQQSLHNLITKGKGNPNPKDGVNTINSENIEKWELRK